MPVNNGSGIGIIDDRLRQHHCRWIISGKAEDTMYCGDPVSADKPYCPEHCKLAYNPNSKDICRRIEKMAMSARKL